MFLRLKAPFASFRPFQSGSFRSTTPVPSPSAVYGLLLNLAGIDQRTELDAPITQIRKDLPKMAIAIALPQGANPKTTILCQQLHQYSVGGSDKELAQKTHGAKSWIAPVRREVLVDVDLVIGCRAEDWLCDLIIRGLNGELEQERYGLPFAGDNNFLFDSIEPIQLEKFNKLMRWYFPINEDSRPSRGCYRLSIWIDRTDNTKTQTAVFALSDFVMNPPESAWVQLPVDSVS